MLPFSDIIDWTRLTITWMSHDLEGIVPKLESFPPRVELGLRSQVFEHYDKYFSSMSAIAIATLDVINRRVFPLAKVDDVMMTYM